MSYQTWADLGGQTGHGAVLPEPEGVSELWHAAWEPRALALTLAMGASGAWNIDQSRAVRETLPDYAQLSYYQIWLSALERLLAERGLVAEDELAAGHGLHPPLGVPRVLAADQVAAALARGSPTSRPATAPARFAPGDRVRTSLQTTPHHSRLPAYARGRTGRIDHVQGVHVFADANAQGLGEQPQWLYSVVFAGTDLWGADTDPDVQVCLDAWESTLEEAAADPADSADSFDGALRDSRAGGDAT
jgi:nitrile hydratase beta subunit